MIAVKKLVDAQNVTAPHFEDNDEDDYDEPEDTFGDVNDTLNTINIDWIGNVKEKLDYEKCVNVGPTKFIEKKTKSSPGEKPTLRIFQKMYSAFINKLEKEQMKSNNTTKKKDENKDNDDNKDKPEKPDKPTEREPFERYIYPRRKRFCIFVK